jgi:peptidoglycan/LPS O-acetylase OafA/YrhL
MKKNNAHDYLPGIDGLRAIAVLAVVIYHTNFFPFFKGGFIGVDIFFVISGYVIARSIHNRPFSRISRYLSDFYVRRAKRIIPALVACLLVTIVASTLFIPSSWLSSTIDQTGLAAFFGYGNFSLVWNNDGYFSPRVDFNPFLHTWSLGVEEQFYILFPMIFFMWLKFGKEKSAVGYFSRGLLFVLGISSLGFAVFETTAFHDRAFYLLPGRFWELTAGALLFQLHSNKIFVFESRNVSRLLMVAGLLAIAAGFIFADQGDFPFPWALIPVFATMLLLTGVVNNSARSSLPYKFLNSTVATYIGKISYSLYLWHWPVAVLLRWTYGLHTYWLALIYIAASFILAIVSYHFIETPVRTNRFLFRQKNWKIIASGIAVLFITFSIAQLVVSSKTDISLSVTKDNYEWRSWKYEKDEPAQPITVDPDIGGRRIFALGDSHTAAYRTMLHIVSGQLGIEVIEYEAGGCAIAGLLKPMAESGNCTSFYERSFREIKESAKPGDIVFLASLRMPTFSDIFEVIDTTSVLADFNSIEASKNRSIALEEASLIIGDFEDLGLHVLIVAPEPVLKAPPYRCADWFNKMNPICSPGLTISRDFLLEVRKPVMDSLTTLQKRHPDLDIWDPLYVLCDEEEFSAFDDDGLPVFFDGDHISAHGNRILAPSFKEKILAIWKR